MAMKKLFFILIFSCNLLSVAVSYERLDFFTNNQEEYLAEHLDVFAYFNQLYDEKTPEEIGKEYDLSERKNLQYLKELANIGVLQMPEKNNLSSPVKFLVHGVLNYKENGPLSKKLSQQIIKQIFEKIENDIKTDKGKYPLFGFLITEEELIAYQKELNDLTNKYIDISLKNKTNKIREAHRVYDLRVLIPNWEPNVFSHIPRDIEDKRPSK